MSDNSNNLNNKEKREYLKEISRLKEENKEYEKSQNKIIEYSKFAKQQAIKEFAKKLKDKLAYCDEDYDICYSFFQEDLDKLLKEYGIGGENG